MIYELILNLRAERWLTIQIFVPSHIRPPLLNEAIQVWEHDYTGCPRRYVPDIGKMSLMLKHTDITQNTYIQS
jgi:hypothetical protein